MNDHVNNDGKSISDYLEVNHVVSIIIAYLDKYEQEEGYEKIFLRITNLIDNQKIAGEVLKTDRTIKECIDILPTGKIIEFDKKSIIEIAMWQKQW
nr:hypothetical protein [uncultured Arsenicibacter sp.]